MHCLDQAPMAIKCQPGYMIKIRTATIQRNNRGCALVIGDTCVVATITTDVWNTCNGKPSCDYTAQEPASNPCASSMGDPYLAVTYFCEPGEWDMCSFNIYLYVCVGVCVCEWMGGWVVEWGREGGGGRVGGRTGVCACVGGRASKLACVRACVWVGERVSERASERASE